MNTVVLTPSGSLAFTANVQSSTLSVFALDPDNSISFTGQNLTTGGTPLGVALKSDGSAAYAVSSGSSDVAVFSIDPADNVTDTGVRIPVPLGPPSGQAGVNGIALGPNDELAYVVNRVSDTVSILDLTSSAYTGTAIATASRPTDIVLASLPLPAQCVGDPTSGDSDGDGVCDDADVCPGEDDTLDRDGDSLPDCTDPCPLNVENDADGDTICEDTDKCPEVDNPDQSDTDGDGVGDAREPDSDGDGLIDDEDSCPSTAPGATVDAAGCALADHCRCDGEWQNHGAYVSCVSHAANQFKAAGLIAEQDVGALVSAAAQSDCG